MTASPGGSTWGRHPEAISPTGAGEACGKARAWGGETQTGSPASQLYPWGRKGGREDLQAFLLPKNGSPLPLDSVSPSVSL